VVVNVGYPASFKPLSMGGDSNNSEKSMSWSIWISLVRLRSASSVGTTSGLLISAASGGGGEEEGASSVEGALSSDIHECLDVFCAQGCDT
jgi:hypothetical protein